MMKILFLSVLSSLMAMPSAFGSDLPPIGKRVYVSNQNDPYGELEIAPLGKVKAGRLRDPGDSQEKSSKVVAKPLAKSSKPQGYKQNKMKFAPAQVTGGISKPRVNFSRELLPVKRVDEPITQNFYDRVFTETSGDL